MSYKTTTLETKHLNTTIRDIFRNYRKRKVSVVWRGDDEVTISHDPHWSGGSKTDETFLRRSGTYPVVWTVISREEAGRTAPRCREDGTPIVGLAGPFLETTMDDGVICVQTGTFCGKTATMRITGKDDDIAWIDNA